MTTDPLIKQQSKTINRTIRLVICEDMDLYNEFIAQNHVYREAYNKGMEYQLQRPEKLYPLMKSPNSPDAYYAMLTVWRNNGELTW